MVGLFLLNCCCYWAFKSLDISSAKKCIQIYQWSSYDMRIYRTSSHDVPRFIYRFSHDKPMKSLCFLPNFRITAITFPLARAALFLGRPVRGAGPIIGGTQPHLTARHREGWGEPGAWLKSRNVDDYIDMITPDVDVFLARILMITHNYIPWSWCFWKNLWKKNE